MLLDTCCPLCDDSWYDNDNDGDDDDDAPKRNDDGDCDKKLWAKAGKTKGGREDEAIDIENFQQQHLQQQLTNAAALIVGIVVRRSVATSQML